MPVHVQTGSGLDVVVEDGHISLYQHDGPTIPLKDPEALLEVLAAEIQRLHPKPQPLTANEMKAAMIDAVNTVRDGWIDEYEHYAISGAPTGLSKERCEAVSQACEQIIETLQSVEVK